MSKKEGLKVKRDLAKLERNLGGIKNLEKLPSVIFVIDTKKEHIAVTEANRLHIPVVAIVDTNCDPDVIDYVIPGNDDAIRSANLMARVIADAVNEGRELGRRRNARPGTRSEDPAPAVAAAPVRPQRTPEQEKEFQERQAAAKAAAATKQREIEERAKAKAKPVIPPPPGAETTADETPADETTAAETPAAETPAAEAPAADAETPAPAEATTTTDAPVATEGA
jgi:small subunit ribosomal protein S2